MKEEEKKSILKKKLDTTETKIKTNNNTHLFCIIIFLILFFILSRLRQKYLNTNRSLIFQLGGGVDGGGGCSLSYFTIH